MKQVLLISLFLIYVISFEHTFAGSVLSVAYVDQSYHTSDSDGSPNKPFRTIQEAITNVAPGASIFLAQGEYFESIRIISPVHLIGPQNGKATIIAPAGNSSAIRFEAAGSVSDVTITSDPTWRNYQDNFVPIGIAVRGSATDVSVTRCVISHCSVGVEALASLARVQILESKFHDNEYAIGIVSNQGAVHVRNSTLTQNQTGIFASDSDAVIELNTINENVHGIHVASRRKVETEPIVKIRENSIVNNSLTGIWIDEGFRNRLVLNAGDDGDPGRNVIGGNRIYDIFNDTRNFEVSAAGNTFTTTKLANVRPEARIRIRSDKNPSILLTNEHSSAISDDVPPKIKFTVNPTEVFETGEFVEIRANIEATDENGDVPVVILSSVESDEFTSSPMEDVKGVDMREEDREFLIKAKTINHPVRTYTVTYSATDSAGNTSSASQKIKVISRSRKEVADEN